MANGNARLRISFEFDLTLPAGLAQTSDEALLAQLQSVLGPTVFGGMPTVTRKQLTKAGIHLESHSSRCEVETSAAAVPIELVSRAAPHLTAEEMATVARLAVAKLPAKASEQLAHVRRVGLKLANDYRLVVCRLRPEQSIGGIVEMTAHLNLTNGGVLVDDAFKKIKLKTDQGPIAIRVDEANVTLKATLGGHTLGGPLLEVSIDDIATHREALVACWQSAHA